MGGGADGSVAYSEPLFGIPIQKHHLQPVLFIYFDGRAGTPDSWSCTVTADNYFLGASYASHMHLICIPHEWIYSTHFLTLSVLVPLAL